MKTGLTMIELMVSLSVVSFLILAAIFASRTQLIKGRDAKRKADLVKIQQALEDYLNDNTCYPETFTCGQNFSPYLTSVPCDPLNGGVNIYYYSVSSQSGCKIWYKIFTNLENKTDPVVEKIGCTPQNCGSFNYGVSSPNVELQVKQPGEVIK
jgi:prepilin-type N-terminal cleavage/methylation domain-containing protein